MWGSSDQRRTCACKTTRRRLTECRKEHEQLIVITGPTKRLDGLGHGGQGSTWPDVEKWDGCVERLRWFLPKMHTMNIYRRYKIRLSRECVIGWGDVRDANEVFPSFDALLVIR